MELIGKAIIGNFSVRQIAPKIPAVICDTNHRSISPLSTLSLKFLLEFIYKSQIHLSSVHIIPKNSCSNLYYKSQTQISSVQIIPKILAVIYATNHRPSSSLSIVICSLSKINSTAATLQ